MSDRPLFLTLFLMILIPASQLTAVGTTSGGSILLRPSNARQAGMAEAVSSLDAEKYGISMIHYNPGSAAFLKSPEVSLTGQRGFAGDQYAALYYGMPVYIGSLAAGFSYYSLGDIELIDNQDRFLGNFNAEKDYAFILNYSENFFETIGAGINIRFLNSTLLEQYSSNAACADIGAQIRFPRRNVSLGLAVLNVGSNLQYISEGEPLPLTVRAGGSYLHAFDTDNKTTFSVDIFKLRGEDPKAFLGVEYLWTRLLALRTGYKIGQELGRFNAGLGFLFDKFRLDYAYADAGDTGQTHSFSLTYKFQQHILKPAITPREKTRVMLKKTIAILNMQSPVLTHEESQRFSDILQNTLSRKRDNVALMDRNKLLAAIHQEFPYLIHCNDPSCAGEIGSTLGADKVIVGSVELIGGYYLMHVRIVDTQSLKVDYEDRIQSNTLSDLEEQISSMGIRIAYTLE